MEKLIVSRHPAAIEFIKKEVPGFHKAEVKAEVAPADVMNKDVVGNLPMGLAALCWRYRAIEFRGRPPRGLEYTLEDMYNSGAYIAEYKVIRVQ